MTLLLIILFLAVIISGYLSATSDISRTYKGGKNEKTMASLTPRITSEKHLI